MDCLVFQCGRYLRRKLRRKLAIFAILLTFEGVYNLKYSLNNDNVDLK